MNNKHEIITSWTFLTIGCAMTVMVDKIYHLDLAEFIFRTFIILTTIMINLALLKYCYTKEK